MNLGNELSLGDPEFQSRQARVLDLAFGRHQAFPDIAWILAAKLCIGGQNAQAKHPWRQSASVSILTAQ
jgi:hypothetical protein